MIKPTSDRKVGVEQTVKKWPEMIINRNLMQSYDNEKVS